jgi:DNA-binding transcriptional MerR regulator
MFKIGEFSRLGQVTIDTLRHYDALGLLKPAQVDRFTGYRYYSATQLQHLNRILALKELGFSLEEVARILQDEYTDEQLRGMLKMQTVLAERDLLAAQSRLDRIVARLKSIESEGNMSRFEVTVKSVDAATVAAIRETVLAVEQMPERCAMLFDTIARWMVAHKLPFGPAMTTYFAEEYTRQDIDVECAFVLPGLDAASLPRPEAPIVVQQLDAMPKVAVTVVTEGFYKQVDGLTPAYNALGRWIEANGYRIVGPVRELFHGSPEEGDLTAEIQLPVEKEQQ